MDEKTLTRLEKLNQLKLLEDEKSKVLNFFDKASDDAKILDSVNTDNVEIMVHVMPMQNVLREDVCIKNYTREDLQKDAPAKENGYWQVPRLVE